MGIIVNDVIYINCSTMVINAYINISNNIYIKKSGFNYEINTYYNCYLNKLEKDNGKPPFYQVSLKLTGLTQLSLMYKKLYDLVKKDFILTKDV